MISNQAYLFAIFIIIGVIICLLFDFFRILRRVFKTADFITYIEDIIFWILTGFIVLYSVFTFNNGEIRIFMFLGIMLGVIAYMLFLSKYIIKINVKIFNFVKLIIKTPIMFIYKILKKYLFNPINIVIINIGKFSTKFVHKKDKILKHPEKTAKN